MNHPLMQPRPMSLDDFEDLLADQPEGERWELISGRVVRMMVGARWEHNRIIGNLHFDLRRRFEERDSPCRVFTETFRLQEAAASSSLLPDLIVACQPLPPGAASLDNPTVVIEVLSDGTGRRDREDKWAVYRSLPSLRHYALVARDEASLQIFDRHDGGWGLRIVEGLDADLTLPHVDISIPLRRVYKDVLA